MAQLNRTAVTLAALVAVMAFAPSTAGAFATFYFSKATFDAASNTSLLEDFSTAPAKDVLLASLTLHGVTYTGLAGSPSANVLVASPGYPNFGADVGITTDYILTANGDEDIKVAFSTPYTAVGFNAFYNGLGPGTVTVFGASNTAIGVFAPLFGQDPATGLADKGYLGFTSPAPIYGFEWKTTLGGRLNTGFTNISVGTARVPEPAGWIMMILGVSSAGAVLRRRRAAVATA